MIGSFSVKTEKNVLNQYTKNSFKHVKSRVKYFKIFYLTPQHLKI